MSTNILASAVLKTLQHCVSAYNVHPMLVNFTAALIPVSVGSEILARVFDKPSLRDAGWWTLCFAAVITPFTASAGWLLWSHDDDGVIGMSIHKWLGTSLAVLLLGLVLWRWSFFKSNSHPSILYLLIASIVVVAVFFQGHLGGKQSFGCISTTHPDTLLTMFTLHRESAELCGFADHSVPQATSLDIVRWVRVNWA